MNVVPVTLLVNAIDGAVPEQIVCEDGVAVATGTGLTVISTVIVEPLHPLALGVTVYLTTPAVVPVLVNVCDIEDPQAEGQLLKPVIVPPVGGVRIAAVQVNVVPVTLLDKAMDDEEPEQIVREGGVAVATGRGLTVTVTDALPRGQLPIDEVTV